MTNLLAYVVTVVLLILVLPSFYFPMSFDLKLALKQNIHSLFKRAKNWSLFHFTQLDILSYFSNWISLYQL